MPYVPKAQLYCNTIDKIEERNYIVRPYKL